MTILISRLIEKKNYLQILKKTERERAAYTETAYWSYMCDLGYFGKETDDFPPRKFAPIKKKRLLSEDDIALNERLSRTRIRIEMFFGRL